MISKKNFIRWILKPLVFILSLVPLALLGWSAYNGTLSADPIADITHETGVWTLRFLLITLGITPLRKITGWTTLISFRRMLGLFAFFYVCLHFTTYIWLDQFFQWNDILKDVAKRPFITAGFTAFVLLIPLAVTSTNKMVRWMGGKRWQALHRLVYGAAIAGVIHYLWLVKADKHRPIIYGAILAVLLGVRVWLAIQKRSQQKKKIIAIKPVSDTPSV